jgi:hypothetical protein
MNKFTIGCAVVITDPDTTFDIGNVVGLTTNCIGELCVEVKWAAGWPGRLIHPNKITEFAGTVEELDKFYQTNKKSRD